MTAAQKYIKECRKWHEAHKVELQRKRWDGFYPLPKSYIIE